MAVEAHLGRPEDIDGLIDATVDEYGRIDIVVNNAANPLGGPLTEITELAFQKSYEVNVRGPLFLAARAIDYLAASGHGSIINVITYGAFEPGETLGLYCSGKAALWNLTRVMAKEWAPRGVRANAIAPGPFPTEGASKRLRPGGSFTDSSKINPMRRVGQMSELQNLATFLMADGCEWLTGETIAIDGGGYLASGSGGYFTELDKLSDADWEKMRAMIKAQNDKDRAGRTA